MWLYKRSDGAFAPPCQCVGGRVGSTRGFKFSRMIEEMEQNNEKNFRDNSQNHVHLTDRIRGR